MILFFFVFYGDMFICLKGNKKKTGRKYTSQMETVVREGTCLVIDWFYHGHVSLSVSVDRFSIYRLDW